MFINFRDESWSFFHKPLLTEDTLTSLSNSTQRAMSQASHLMSDLFILSKPRIFHSVQLKAELQITLMDLKNARGLTQPAQSFEHKFPI